jgi:hypothetical protein
MKTKLIIAGTFLTLVAASMAFAEDGTAPGTTAGKPTPGQIERRGERMEQRKDRQDERIEQRHDRRAQRAK